MHNLTHPVVLLIYLIVLGAITIRALRRTKDEQTGVYLLGGLAALHLSYFFAYIITLFLPIGYGQVIRPDR